MNDRVTVSRWVVNMFTMQVCAVRDATDDEILEVCNRDNPAGTTNGWATVVRQPDGSLGQEENKTPVQCADDPDRLHFLVLC